MTLLELDDVTAFYGPVQVLEGVSLSVPDGGAVGILRIREPEQAPFHRNAPPKTNSEGEKSNTIQAIVWVLNLGIHACNHRPRCLVPAFDGTLFSAEWKDALWAKYFTEAPARQRRSVERYNIVKRA